MKLFRMATVCAVAALAAASLAAAQEHRELGAHEHGVATLNIAVEGNEVAMELEAPGADIIGFEHPATSDEDRAAVANATTALKDPLALFVVPGAAGCSLDSAEVTLVSEGHDEHGEHATGHEGEEHHDEAAEADHEHEEQAAHREGEQHHEDVAEAEHGHQEEARHTEFQAVYKLTCEDVSRVTAMDFRYFEAFPNAEEVDITLVDEHGARSFEVERPSPSVDFSSAS